jgi:hypothetical protein
VAPFKIRNETSLTLSIFISFSYSNHVESSVHKINEGTIKPGAELNINNLGGNLNVYLVEAVNSAGESIFSKEYYCKELEKTIWVVIITE